MFGKLLKKYRKEAKYTQGELAYRLSVILNRKITNENIRSWENGTNPKLDIIIPIAEILNIPEQYLFNDSKESINKIVNKEVPNFNSFNEHTKKVVLVDGYVGAGSGGYPSNDMINYLYVDNFMIKKSYKNKEISGLTVIGDSMFPYVNDGDIVLFSMIEKNQYKLNDGKYIIETINGTMIKNLSFRSNGDIIISSCNKAYPDELIKSNETQEFLDIIGIVVGRILKS